MPPPTTFCTVLMPCVFAFLARSRTLQCTFSLCGPTLFVGLSTFSILVYLPGVRTVCVPPAKAPVIELWMGCAAVQLVLSWAFSPSGNHPLSMPSMSISSSGLT